LGIGLTISRPLDEKNESGSRGSIRAKAECGGPVRNSRYSDEYGEWA
jgi:hypothetical protein